MKKTSHDMTVRHLLSIAIVVIAAGASLSADRVRLRSGKVVEGMFIGGDSKTVRVLLDSGSVSEIRIEDAVAVEFSARKPAPSPTPTPTPTPSPAAAPKPVTVPAGTALNVRLTQAIDVDVSQAGQTFKAIVDDPVMIGGSVVIPRGASAAVQAVQVQQSGKMKGSDKISLKINSIGFGGRVYEVVTGLRGGQGVGRRQAHGPQGWRRRRPRGHCRRYRGRRRRRRDRCSHRRGDRRRGRERRRGALEAGSRNAPAVPAHRRREHSTVINWPWAESVRAWPSASRAWSVEGRVDPRRHPLRGYATGPPRERRGCVPSEHQSAWSCTAAPPVCP